MEKIIRLSIENTTKIRQVEDSFCELYSHDKNNGAFEFEILKGTLTNENVVALFKFLRSGSYWKTTGSVEDNKIKFNFDTSLITQNEEVVCYIYLDKEERNSDIFRFKFKVNLSEIDKASQLPVKERFFANSMIVDRVDVLTREVLNEEIKTLKETFVNNETLPRLVEDELNKKNLITEHQDISNLATKDAVDEVAKKVTKLEERPSYDDSDVKQRLTALEGANFLTEHQDISNLATKKSVEDVEAKVTQLEARPSYDDSEIKRKIKELEDRPVTANIDTSNFVTTTQLEDKHYLTEHQDIKGLATKEELRKAFLDDEDHEKYAKKTELPQPYNDADIKSRLTVLENKPSGSSSELRGHGFPSNNDVPIGTTYIDEDVTNGALKWIKTKTKWKVIEGDTGWVNVPVKNVQPNTKMELRRVNNLVYVRFFNELAEGLAKFTNLYNADTTTRYLTIFKGLASFGWRPSTTQIQVIFPEINQGGNDYIYNTAQPPQPYLRLKTIGAGLNVDMQLDEFVITNNNLGVYINSFSYLTNDDWAPSLNII